MANYGNYGIDKAIEALEQIAAIYHDGDAPLAGIMAFKAREALDAFTHYFQMPSKGNGEKCPVCGHKDGYNGWSNYETWEVALELSNEQGSNETCEELVRDAGSVADGARALEQYWSDYVDELLMDVYGMRDGTGNIPFSSLYTASWSALDWYEIAASFKPDEWGDSDTAPEETDETDE